MLNNSSIVMCKYANLDLPPSKVEVFFANFTAKRCQSTTPLVQ